MNKIYYLFSKLIIVKFKIAYNSTVHHSLVIVHEAEFALSVSSLAEATDVEDVVVVLNWIYLVCL